MRSQSSIIELQQILLQPNISQENDRAASPLLPLPRFQPKRATYSRAALGESPTAIRVLEVEAPLNYDDTMIQCELKVVDLADRPPFTALSYVWGDPTVQEAVWCGNDPVMVTRNAWQALRRLRSKFSPLRIWIDAICINQADDVEKARQIPLMSKIYSSAERVYVWLGEGDKKTDRVMRYLATGALFSPKKTNDTVADLANVYGPQFEGAAMIPTGHGMRVWLNFRVNMQKFLFRRRLYLSTELKEVFSRPWIKRVWTLQEVLLAPTPVLVCGDVSVSWFAFLCAAEVFEFCRTGPRRRRIRATPLIAKGLHLLPEIEPWLQLATMWKSWHGQEAGSVTPPSRASIDGDLVGQPRQYSQGQVKASMPDPPLPKSRDFAAPLLEESHVGFRNVLLEAHADHIARIHDSWAPDFVPVIHGLVIIILASGSIAAIVLRFVGTFSGHETLIGLGFLLSILTGGYSFMAVHLWRRDYRTAKLARYQRSTPWKLVLMTQMAIRQCAVREDRYNGVLGIIHSHATVEADGHLAMRSEDWHAYRSLCLTLISWHESLDFLLFLSAGKMMQPGAPSWVVQWHTADTMWATYLYRYDLFVDHFSHISGGMPGATPGSEPWHVWDPRSPHELRVHAVFLADITWRTWMEPTDNVKVQRSTLAKRMREAALARPTTMETIKASGSAFHAVQKSQFMQRAIEDHRAVVQYETPAIRLFGMASHDVQYGDRLALVSGLSLPIVLRRANAEPYETYRVVGPVFMPGLNEGQAWTEENRQKLEEIVLV